jgi:hypothetical protein
VIVNTRTLESRTAYTDRAGRYRFDGLDAGDFYVVTATKGKRVFEPTSLAVVLHEAVADLNYTAR